MKVFQEAEFITTVNLFSPFVDTNGPAGFHAPDPSGRVAIECSTCLYVWVRDTRCMYVGQVRRRSGGVESRFAHHHRHLARLDGVWIIPMVPAIPSRVLNTFEHTLIRLYKPSMNVQRPGVA